MQAKENTNSFISKENKTFLSSDKINQKKLTKETQLFFKALQQN